MEACWKRVGRMDESMHKRENGDASQMWRCMWHSFEVKLILKQKELNISNKFVSSIKQWFPKLANWKFLVQMNHGEEKTNNKQVLKIMHSYK